MDPNQWHVRMTMRVPLFYEEYKRFNYTFYNMNNDDEMCYLWAIRLDISKKRIHVLVEFESLQSQTFSDVQHTHVLMQEDHSNVRQHEDDEVNDDADADYDVLSAFNKDNGDNDKEDDNSTHLNPFTQWFSNTPYDYTSSGAFLDMGSGEQIDDLIKSGTIRLLDLNDAMTDLQLGMRFIDKIQAISIVKKLPIRIGREFIVVKSNSDQWTAKCYHHSD
ncbi:hypothetical protein M9H77_06932 [Catharanthus roseus]|uniref:Uncharacterized protein n=1 Tax=Catharanthus roseus TaxID=4058 RepID=A0ACC0BTH3_CATRO|nr:hypothetical protein M9H77_06932 [Catharanthus roseus]